jgi:hypothetical protein
MIKQEILSVIFQASVFVFWGWIVFRAFVSSKPTRAIITVPFRVFRILLIIATFGVLGGCTNSDPLAVATGPVFALNVGHWQPAPQDLAATPVVAKQ